VPDCQIATLPFLLERFLGRRSEGFFVEVGAFDGISYSNTWGLAERGWSGLLVEPVPHLADECRRNHSSHPHVRIVECAIGAATGATSLILNGPLTTAHAGQAEEWAYASAEAITVPMITLDSLLSREEVCPGFELLVVDVEGFEADVFAAFDLARWRPLMMIVELADTHPDLQNTAAADAQLSRSIEANGYRIVYKDHINTVFVLSDRVDEQFVP
jgi:FkbM family methyltransferase